MNNILERTDAQVQTLTDKMRLVEQKVVRARAADHPIAHWRTLTLLLFALRRVCCTGHRMHAV